MSAVFLPLYLESWTPCLQVARIQTAAAFVALINCYEAKIARLLAIYDIIMMLTAR